MWHQDKIHSRNLGTNVLNSIFKRFLLIFSDICHWPQTVVNGTCIQMLASVYFCIFLTLHLCMWMMLKCSLSKHHLIFGLNDVLWSNTDSEPLAWACGLLQSTLVWILCTQSIHQSALQVPVSVPRISNDSNVSTRYIEVKIMSGIFLVKATGLCIQFIEDILPL